MRFGKQMLVKVLQQLFRLCASRGETRNPMLSLSSIQNKVSMALACTRIFSPARTSPSQLDNAHESAPGGSPDNGSTYAALSGTPKNSAHTACYRAHQWWRSITLPPYTFATWFALPIVKSLFSRSFLPILSSSTIYFDTSAHAHANRTSTSNDHFPHRSFISSKTGKSTVILPPTITRSRLVFVRPESTFLCTKFRMHSASLRRLFVITYISDNFLRSLVPP